MAAGTANNARPERAASQSCPRGVLELSMAQKKTDERASAAIRLKEFVSNEASARVN